MPTLGRLRRQAAGWARSTVGRRDGPRGRALRARFAARRARDDGPHGRRWGLRDSPATRAEPYGPGGLLLDGYRAGQQESRFTPGDAPLRLAAGFLADRPRRWAARRLQRQGPGAGRRHCQWSRPAPVPPPRSGLERVPHGADRRTRPLPLRLPLRRRRQPRRPLPVQGLRPGASRLAVRASRLAAGRSTGR